MDRGKLARGLIFGAVIGAVAIGLFLFLFMTVLSGWEQPARLFTAFFAPIIFIALAIFVYRLMTN